MKKLIQNLDRIFIAGHKGMVGSAILRHLKVAGYQNTLTISRSDLDLRHTESVQKWMTRNKPNVVVIAAAKVGGIYANSIAPTEFLLDNLKVQNNIIESAWQNGVRRLCFLGSSCIYPKFAKQPITEESLLTGELEPTNSSYAIAKIAGIKLIESLRSQYGFDGFSLMPTNLYGPGDNYHPQNSHVMAAFIRRFCMAADNSLSTVTCWGSGKPRREFLHVDDLAAAVIFSLEFWQKDLRNPSFLNVGTGEDITIKELAEKVADAAGFSGKIHWDTSKPDGTPRKLLDVSRILGKGWQPKISLNKGIKSVIDIWRDS